MGEFLAHIHSDVLEGLTGDCKDLVDDKLPHRKMMSVEPFDASIQIADTIGMYFVDDIPSPVKSGCASGRASGSPSETLTFIVRRRRARPPDRLSWL